MTGASPRPRRRAPVRPWPWLRHALLAGALGLLALAVHAQGLPLPAAGETAARRVQVDLIPETLSAAPGGTLHAVLRMRIAPGWHTYWRNPGDSGLPVSLAWSLPEGVAADALQWPVPQRLPVGPLMNYGYEREARLLVSLRLPQRFAPARLAVAARAEWLVCREVCIPESGPVAFDLPVSADEPRPDPRHQALFAQARAALPAASTGWTVDASVSDPTRRLTITVQPPPGLALSGPAYFFEGTGGLVAHADAQAWSLRRDGLRIEVPLQPGATPSALDGVFVFEASRPADRPHALALGAPLAAQVPDLGPSRASGVTGGAAPAGAIATPGGLGFALALLLALLGGLALNLMPCVFPVLSIKLLSLSAEWRDDGHGARAQALAYGAGVLASFWLLAGALLALRAAGEQVGWGFQLQSPGFVSALAVLFTLIALNLAGVFEVGSRLAGLAGQAAGNTGLRGAFLNGALAVAVAAPCTAPFMGAALGYALAQSAGVALAVFGALALGMALPFVVLAWIPGLARRMPRPGPWMVAFRQAMAFPLLATVGWLAWVLGAQAGNDAVFALLCGLVAVALAAWIWGRFVQAGTGGRRRLAAGALSGLIAAGGLALAWPGAPSAAPRPAADMRWEAWSEATVSRLRAEGRPVFIDFTAAWCVTCQVNKRVVLDAPEVVARFAESGVVGLRADWTLRDPEITRALQGYGRSGVPVYVLYTPGAASPRLLPELLTRQSVLGALPPPPRR